MKVGWDEVRARRLLRSSLSERASADRLVEVAGAVCGVQAQLQTAAELQLAARVDGVTQADVRAAVWERRVLVRAWTLRGTLHLHPAGELPLWHAARLAAVGSAGEGLPAWRDPARVLHPALAADEVEAVRAPVWEALDGRCLLRDELTTAPLGQPTSSHGSAPQRSGWRRRRLCSTSWAPSWRRSTSTAAAPSSWPATGRSRRRALRCGCCRSTTCT